MRGLLLFDIDGVIRDVSGSYRLAIQETVNHFTHWRPSIETIDALKTEGSWNNDWNASFELIRRHKETQEVPMELPELQSLIKIFSDFYFGGNPEGDSKEWDGFIKNEPLLIQEIFFKKLSQQKISYGFVSGAEPASAKYILENRLKIKNPSLVAMGDAPDKPDPTGLIQIATKIFGSPLGSSTPPIAYLGDTVADVLTIRRARKNIPKQRFISLAVAPPHLQREEKHEARKRYENSLKNAGADEILSCTNDAIDYISSW